MRKKTKRKKGRDASPQRLPSGAPSFILMGAGYFYFASKTTRLPPRPLRENPRTSRFRVALTRLAQKFDDFPKFSQYYWNGLARNTYWIGTENKDFVIKDLEKQFAKEGRLIAYVHPEMIKEPYAAEVDISFMNPLYDVTENPKDPSNSIKIIRPDLLKIRYVTPVSKAVKIWEYNSRYFPSSQYELLQFWNAAHARKDVAKPARRRRSKIPPKKGPPIPMVVKED